MSDLLFHVLSYYAQKLIGFFFFKNYVVKQYRYYNTCV